MAGIAIPSKIIYTVINKQTLVKENVVLLKRCSDATDLFRINYKVRKLILD